MARKRDGDELRLRAWTFKDPKQVAKVGERKASWCVGWYTPAGVRKQRSFGAGKIGRDSASDFAAKMHKILSDGRYAEFEDAERKAKEDTRHTWKAFKARYEAVVVPTLSEKHTYQLRNALSKFEQHCNPDRLEEITTETIDEFKAKRQTDRGLRPGTTVSASTVNQNLGYIRMVLMKAQEWDYIRKVPKFSLLKVPKRIKAYVEPDHFPRLYAACKVSKAPFEFVGIDAADWWRSLFTFAYMTGWRIGQILALRWEDVDLAQGVILSRAEDNKGKRDVLIALPDEVVRHLCMVRTGQVVVFPWVGSRRRLYDQFQKIQAEAGIAPTGKDRYGFHDFRRGFGTMNADRLTERQLTELMQHRDKRTTDLYVNMARQLRPAAANVFVPSFEVNETEDR